MILRRKCVLVAVVGLAAVLAGCGETEIQLQYDRPAQVEIPDNIKVVAVAPFTAAQGEDRAWAEYVSDRIVAELSEQNRRHGRYTIVDRKRLKQRMDERDLQIMINDTGSAGQVGKEIGVDAMVYGKVLVEKEDQNATRTTVDWRGNPKTVHYTKRYVLASVSFNMDTMANGKTLVALAEKREFDSEKAKQGASKIASFMGFGGSNPPPMHETVSALVDESVEKFVAMITPHTVDVTVKLSGGDELVKTGNKLAKAGDYAEAAQFYDNAIAKDPADHGAIYNRGVMYEATGDLDKARQLYDKAFKIKPEEKYVQSRSRVDRILGD